MRVLGACSAALQKAKWAVKTDAARFIVHASDSDVSFDVQMLQPRAGVVLVELKAKVRVSVKICFVTIQILLSIHAFSSA